MVLPDLLLWFTLLPSASSSRCCRLCLAACQSWRLLEEFPLLRASAPRYSHLEIWTSSSSSYLSVLWCLGVASGVRRIFGTRALLGSTVDTCSTGGLWRGELRSEAFTLHSSRMEKCAQLMLRVAVSLSAVRTLNLDIIATSSPW